MAHHAYTRAGNIWNASSVLLSTEAAAFDLKIYKSINGDDGGTWTNAAPIILGGDFEVAGLTDLENVNSAVWQSGGTLDVESGGAVTFDSGASFAVNCAATFANTIGFSGATVSSWATGATGTWATGTTLAMASGSTLTLGGAVNLTSTGVFTIKSSGDIQVESGGLIQWQASSSMTSAGIWTWTGGSATFQSGCPVDFGGTVAMNGAITQAALLTKSGSSGRTALRYSAANDADQTLDVSKDVWQIPATLTGNRTYTLRSTSSPIPTTGETIRIVRTAPGGISGHLATIQREDATVLFLGGLSYHLFVDVIWDGVAWTLLDAKLYNNAALTNTGLYGN